MVGVRGAEVAGVHVGGEEVLAGQLGLEVVEPAAEEPVDQGPLGGEVVQHAALGHARLRGDRVERERGRAVAPDHGDGRVEQLHAPAGARHQCVPATLSPITPATISTIETIFSALAGSPSTTIPITAIAAVPAPAQIA